MHVTYGKVVRGVFKRIITIIILITKLKKLVTLINKIFINVGGGREEIKWRITG